MYPPPGPPRPSLMARDNVVEFHRRSAGSAVKQTLASRTHVADIVSNESVTPPVFHFIVTRKDSPEIIYWGQASSHDEAIEGASAMLKFYEGHASTFAQ